MKLSVKDNDLIVRVRFYETSVFFLLPLLLLPLASEDHYRYINLYMVLAVFNIWLYIREIKYPVLLLKNDVLSVRQFITYAYLRGCLTHEAMTYKLTAVSLKDISKIEADYPVISIFQTDAERVKVVLKVSREDFILIKERLGKSLSVIDQGVENRLQY